MSRESNARHLYDEALILHYFGEDGRAERESARRHLASCEACRDEWKKGGCTRELKPACGVKADGSTAGGANPCVACQDGAVGWKDGACP